MTIGLLHTERDVVRLEHTDRVRAGIGRKDVREGLAGEGEGLVVHTRDLHADRHREIRRRVGERHVVKNDGLCVTRPHEGRVTGRADAKSLHIKVGWNRPSKKYPHKVGFWKCRG